MKRILLICCSFCWLAACANKASNENARHYQLTGQITVVDTKDHTVTVNAAAIPNFMEAMTMEYPVKSESELSRLRVGDRIKATVNVYPNDRYDLSAIRKTEGSK